MKLLIFYYDISLKIKLDYKGKILKTEIQNTHHFIISILQFHLIIFADPPPPATSYPPRGGGLNQGLRVQFFDML